MVGGPGGDGTEMPQSTATAPGANYAATREGAHVLIKLILLAGIALFGVLERLAPSPVVTLNRAVAVAEVHGPEAGLDQLASLDDDRITSHHRFHAVRAHLLERTGDLAGAKAAYLDAGKRTTNLTEQRYLAAKAARL